MKIHKGDLELAQGWARQFEELYDTSPSHAGAAAAIRIMLNLPNEVVDGAKVREVAEEMNKNSYSDVEEGRDEGFRYACDVYSSRLEDILEEEEEEMLPPRVTIRRGVSAQHHKLGEVTILSNWPNGMGEVWVAWDDTTKPNCLGLSWVRRDELTPTDDVQDSPAEVIKQSLEELHSWKLNSEGDYVPKYPVFNKTRLYRDRDGDVWSWSTFKRKWVCYDSRNDIQATAADLHDALPYAPFTEVIS